MFFQVFFTSSLYCHYQFHYAGCLSLLAFMQSSCYKSNHGFNNTFPCRAEHHDMFCLWKTSRYILPNWNGDSGSRGSPASSFIPIGKPILHSWHHAFRSWNSPFRDLLLHRDFLGKEDYTIHDLLWLRDAGGRILHFGRVCRVHHYRWYWLRLCRFRGHGR